MRRKIKEPNLVVRPKKFVTIKASPEPIRIDLHRTALIVVDMQNAFVSKKGMFDTFGYDITGSSSVISNDKKIIDSARKVGCRIIYLKMSYSPDYSDSGGPQSPNWHKHEGLVMMRKNPELWGRFVTGGSWDEQICKDLKPKPGDILIRKQRFSGFAGTNLDMVLKTLYIKFCIYIGIATNICVESTIRDGYFLDYWPIIVSDGCCHAGPSITHEATLWNIENFFGWVTTTEALLKAVNSK